MAAAQLPVAADCLWQLIAAPALAELLARTDMRANLWLGTSRQQYRTLVQEIHYDGGPDDDKKDFAGKKGEDGKDGRHGRIATEEGEDGEDGEDGEEGQDGEDGHDAGELDVMIEFESHDPKTNMRTYKVQTKAEGVFVCVCACVCACRLVCAARVHYSLCLELA